MQLYTVEQANRTLPLVRRIVDDVVREHRRRGEKMVELDLLLAGRERAPSDPRATALEREIASLGREIDGFTRELSALGIQLKDPRMGLIDFPANLNGRRVLLCWHHGEPSVQYWHDEHSGFAGRQLLEPARQLAATSSPDLTQKP